MSLAKISDIMREADRGGYAVTAFDCFNFETVCWAIREAEKLERPVIIMLYPRMVKYVTTDVFAQITRKLAEKSKYPVGLMLDHGDSYELAMDCIRAGFSSVMVDFSACDFEENVRRTSEVVKAAHAMGVDVEAELGHVGDASVEADFADDSGFTSPDAAREFVERTGCDVLAIAFGSAHGNYVREPKLDMDRLDAIKAVVDIPLVLHGGTGIPDSQIKEAISKGIRKLNFGTGYDQSIYNALHELMQKETDSPYIFSALNAIEPTVREFLKDKLMLTAME